MKKSFKINDLFDKDLAFNKAIFTVCDTAFTAFDDDNLIEERFSGFTDRDSVFDNERRDELILGYCSWRRTARSYKYCDEILGGHIEDGAEFPKKHRI